MKFRIISIKVSICRNCSREKIGKFIRIGKANDLCVSINNNKKRKLKLVAYFRVYCKFHYMEFQSFASTEDELLYFVRSFHNKTWKWSDQYGSDADDENNDEENRMTNQFVLFQPFSYCLSVFLFSLLPSYFYSTM